MSPKTPSSPSQRLRRAAEANPLLRMGHRARTALSTPGALRERPRETLRFIFRSRQLTNFYYEDENEDEMAALVAEATGTPVDRVSSLFAELRADERLRERLARDLAQNPRRDPLPAYGYRQASYALIRLTRPRVVAELGLHDGLGAALMLRALAENAAEGHPGELHSFDLVEASGWLVGSPAPPNFHKHVGDVTELLGDVLSETGVDILIHDIGHAFPATRDLFETALGAARGRLFITSEVDPPADHLPSLARERGAGFFTFHERPKDHFWPGHEWGIAVFGAEERGA